MGHRLALVIATLQGGGAERVLTGMANHWAAKGWPVTLVTLSGNDEDFYQVDKQVERIGLNEIKPSRNIFASILANVRRVFRLNRTLKALNAEVIISFLDVTNVTTLLATIAMRSKVIVSERNDMDMAALHSVWRGLRKLIYGRADAIVVQTNSQIERVARIVGHRVPIKAIANPVFPSISKSAPVFDVDAHVQAGIKIVMGMGRLEPQKGFDILISAFAKICADVPDWRLLILGEGSQRAELQALVERLDLRDRILLPGMISNTEKALSRADLFVLSSRYEGFPNALVEAMCQELPVISFDCPSGPADIIDHGVDGMLVSAGDEPALAAMMLKLMHDPQLRKGLGARAASVAARYTEDSIMGQWEELMQHVLTAS